MPSFIKILKEDFKGDRSKINATKLNQLQKSGRITVDQNKKLRKVKMAYSKKLAADKKKKAAPAPKKAAPKPKVDKDLLQVTMGIMANVGKEKRAARKTKELKLEPFSIAQLKKIFRSFYEDTHPGRTARIKRNTSRETLVKWIMKDNIPEKYYPKKATKETKFTWTLEGWNLLDDAEEGADPAEALNMYGGVNWKFDNIYPSGFTAFTARATKEEMMKWKRENEENLEKHARVYRETKKTRFHLWDDPFEE